MPYIDLKRTLHCKQSDVNITSAVCTAVYITIAINNGNWTSTVIKSLYRSTYAKCIPRWRKRQRRREKAAAHFAFVISLGTFWSASRNKGNVFLRRIRDRCQLFRLCDLMFPITFLQRCFLAVVDVFLSPSLFLVLFSCVQVSTRYLIEWHVYTFPNYSTKSSSSLLNKS